MRRRHLVHVVSLILLALSGALGFTFLVALAYRDGDAGAFAVSAALLVVLGLIGYWRTELDRDLKVREGYAVVSLAWLAVGAAGALPYMLSGTIESPVAALFNGRVTWSGETSSDCCGPRDMAEGHCTPGQELRERPRAGFSPL